MGEITLRNSKARGNSPNWQCFSCFSWVISQLCALMALLLTRWLVACTYWEIKSTGIGFSSWLGRLLLNGARGVHPPRRLVAERHMQDRPAGSFDFRAESSPSPPPTPLHPREPPRAEWVGCVTQSRDEVKAWVRSNASVLLRSGGGFDKAVYQESWQEMQAALRPLNRCTGILIFTIILIILIITNCRADKHRQHHSFLPGVCWLQWPMRNRKWQWSYGPLQAIALTCSGWFPNEWPLDLLRLWA